MGLSKWSRVLCCCWLLAQSIGAHANAATVADTGSLTARVEAPVTIRHGKSSFSRCVLVWKQPKHMRCCLQTNSKGCARYERYYRTGR